MPTTEPVRPDGGREERPGAVPGEQTVRAAATAGDASATNREVSARV